MSTPSTICPKTGKHIHDSVATAQANKLQLKERRDDDVNVYHCEYCGGWHVGRPRKNAHKNKYANNNKKQGD